VAHTFATESNKHKSKKEMKEQHAYFRGLETGLDGGVAPAETLRFPGTVITVDTWAQHRQLSGFRSLLARGMNVHFQGNMFLRSIFDAGAPPVLAEGEAVSILCRGCCFGAVVCVTAAAVGATSALRCRSIILLALSALRCSARGGCHLNRGEAVALVDIAAECSYCSFCLLP